MIPLDWPLALFVLVSGGFPDADVPPLWERLDGPVAELGIALEVWDRKECENYRRGNSNVVGYLPPYWTQMQDCPSLHELERFPYGLQAAKACLKLNEAYQRHLSANRCMEFPHRWQTAWSDPAEEALIECGHLRSIWDDYLAIVPDWGCITAKRHTLKDLRGKIGEDAWAAGRLPLPVPLELFTEFGR